MQNADQSLAEAWDNSAAAREELGEQPGMIRRAIGLGRSLLDPLAVLASLCGALRMPDHANNLSGISSLVGTVAHATSSLLHWAYGSHGQDGWAESRLGS